MPCAESISQDGGHFDLLMHLGDVYYSGTRREVQERFLNVWPYREGAINRSINSNHEMYSGGYAYFEKTLPEFEQESSYFALQNDHWLLVGLDVAYTDHNIDDTQLSWLEQVIANAGDRKVLLFSHRQLFSRFDDQDPRLAAKLGGLLRSGRILAWYWGHEHRCVLYEPDPRYGGLLGRCLGHGGMPYTRRAVANIPHDHTVGQSIWRRFETKKQVAWWSGARWSQPLHTGPRSGVRPARIHDPGVPGRAPGRSSPHPHGRGDLPAGDRTLDS